MNYCRLTSAYVNIDVVHLDADIEFLKLLDENIKYDRLHCIWLTTRVLESKVTPGE